ncbi:MAG: Ig-like domain-containing protein [Xanthomonadaceae bacterium]|jgi:hypothetical protein|nr:Ig-like domain-containing protein [Xanthomonadaceae bacterium]
MDAICNPVRSSKRFKTSLLALAALAAVGMSGLTLAQALEFASMEPESIEAVPSDRLCTAGFNSVYGWFAVDSLGLGVLEIPGLTQGNCSKATAAGLAVQMGGLTLPLAEQAVYALGVNPPTLNLSLLEPVLCEDYYPSGGGSSNWKLSVKDANDEVMRFNTGLGSETMPGVSSLSYVLSSGALVPQRADGGIQWLRCHAGLASNAVILPPTPANPDDIFSQGFEPLRADLRVEFLDALTDAPLASDRIEQFSAGGSSVKFKVRISNVGDGVAENIRVREFVPTEANLLGPIVERSDCTDDMSQSCSNTGGNSSGIGTNRFAQNIGNLDPGEHREFTLERRSTGTNTDDDQSMALIQVAAFSDPNTTPESNYADNSRSLRIKVVNNMPPVAHAKSVATAEDTPIPIALSGSDPEGAPLTFHVGAGPSHGSLTGTGSNRTYTPADDYFGSDSFTYTVNDGTSSSAPATVSITITPVNDGPRVKNQLQDLGLNEGDDLWVPLSDAFMDPEDDPFSISVSGSLPVGVVYNATGKVILSAGPLGNTTAGVYVITLTATETATSLTATQQFTLTINNMNQDPVVSNTPLQDRTDDEGDTVSFSVASAFEDPDPDDTLTFSVTGGSLPEGISLALNGMVTGAISQTAAVNSPYNITITADDGQDGTVSDSFVWTVTQVNVAPQIDHQLPDRMGQEGVPLGFPNSSGITPTELLAGFTDPDSDVLLITVESQLPAGLLYSQAAGIVGTPAAGTQGVHTVIIRATDPGFLYVEQSFDLIISSP